MLVASERNLSAGGLGGAGVPAPACVTGVVLCGGKSRRMGLDKALLELAGGPLLERAIGVLAPLASEVVIACGQEPRYAELGHRLALDGAGLEGPLAGLAAGLDAAGTEWVLALACDMPRVSTEEMRGLLAIASASANGAGADVCVFASARGVEPLCAVYRKTCLAPMRAALESGERRATAFWDLPAADGQKLTIERLELQLDAGSDAPHMLVNLNTPEELARERRRQGMEE
jgi:molybdopterin-guanine dinucleotide biosynthesis protein A